MNRNGIVVEGFYRGDHLLVDLPGDKHKEREALFLVVVLNHKVIEVRFVLQILVKCFNPPAFRTYTPKVSLFCSNFSRVYPERPSSMQCW